ncbi:MAG: hypothetical protein ACLFTT_05265 [Candidatus Hydrogenedentota bacterium]
MSQETEYELTGMEHSKPFMTPEQYQAFVERFQEAVKPALDRQRDARIRSEEEAKRHLVR